MALELRLLTSFVQKNVEQKEAALQPGLQLSVEDASTLLEDPSRIHEFVDAEEAHKVQVGLQAVGALKGVCEMLEEAGITELPDEDLQELLDDLTARFSVRLEAPSTVTDDVDAQYSMNDLRELFNVGYKTIRRIAEEELVEGRDYILGKQKVRRRWRFTERALEQIRSIIGGIEIDDVAGDEFGTVYVDNSYPTAILGVVSIDDRTGSFTMNSLQEIASTIIDPACRSDVECKRAAYKTLGVFKAMFNRALRETSTHYGVLTMEETIGKMIEQRETNDEVIDKEWREVFDYIVERFGSLTVNDFIETIANRFSMKVGGEWVEARVALGNYYGHVKEKNIPLDALTPGVHFTMKPTIGPVFSTLGKELLLRAIQKTKKPYTRQKISTQLINVINIRNEEEREIQNVSLDDMDGNGERQVLALLSKPEIVESLEQYVIPAMQKIGIDCDSLMCLVERYELGSKEETETFEDWVSAAIGDHVDNSRFTTPFEGPIEKRAAEQNVRVFKRIFFYAEDWVEDFPFEKKPYFGYYFFISLLADIQEHDVQSQVDLNPFVRLSQNIYKELGAKI